MVRQAEPVFPQWIWWCRKTAIRRRTSAGHTPQYSPGLVRGESQRMALYCDKDGDMHPSASSCIASHASTINKPFQDPLRSTRMHTFLKLG